jgi:hypothetical protein
MPVAPPEHTPIGARLRERTQPLAPDDEAYGWAHAYLCEAIGRMLAQVAEVFDPEGDVPPLAPILSPDLCPTWALPWLAQLLGVTLPKGVDDATARAMIKDVSGFKRGTPAAIRAAAGFFLTGSKTVFFNERLANDAYRLGVVTLGSETPDATLVEAAILAQKPGGILLSYAAIAGQTYRAVLTEVDSYREARSTWPTYRAMRDNLPRTDA